VTEKKSFLLLTHNHCHKTLLLFLTLWLSKQMLVTRKHFHPVLIFARNTGAKLSKVLYRAPLYGQVVRGVHRYKTRPKINTGTYGLAYFVGS